MQHILISCVFSWQVLCPLFSNGLGLRGFRLLLMLWIFLAGGVTLSSGDASGLVQEPANRLNFCGFVDKPACIPTVKQVDKQQRKGLNPLVIIVVWQLWKHDNNVVSMLLLQMRTKSCGLSRRKELCGLQQGIAFTQYRERGLFLINLVEVLPHLHTTLSISVTFPFTSMPSISL